MYHPIWFRVRRTCRVRAATSTKCSPTRPASIWIGTSIPGGGGKRPGSRRWGSRSHRCRRWLDRWDHGGHRAEIWQVSQAAVTGAARNEGVCQATGDLLAFLDSDVRWLPGKLKAELDVLERFPDAEAIVSDSRFIVDGQFIGTSWFTENGALRSRAQEIGLLRDRLTVFGRSNRPGRLTADLASALADFQCHISSELARLEAARA
jgi:hypothetical protein